MDSALSSLGFSYTYDALGNITHVYKSNVLRASYVYDDLGQLVRENNVAANKTWTYEYDHRGNITCKKVYAYTAGTLGTVQSTINYVYNNSSFHDQLTSYNGGTAMVYDAIGNPTTYRNGSTYTFSWSKGRKLTSGTKGNTSFGYTYNADGLRTKKTVNGVDYDYYWNGTRLEAMTVTQGQNTEKLLFYYDADGAPYALKYYDRAACLWRTFLYVTNLQGDVVALIDAGSGSTAATYEYDAWGRLVSESISPLPAHALLQYNPLTYRGYIYDEETGFYYLQTRYYDPATRRFLNADGYVSTGTGLLGYNMFAYCNNNPVMRSDPSGEFFEWIIPAVVAVVAVVAVLAIATSLNSCSGPKYDKEVEDMYDIVKNDGLSNSQNMFVLDMILVSKIDDYQPGGTKKSALNSVYADMCRNYAEDQKELLQNDVFTDDQLYLIWDKIKYSYAVYELFTDKDDDNIKKRLDLLHKNGITIVHSE